MFKKILVVEDIDSISLGVVSTLKTDNNIHVLHTKYCDDALLKIKKSIQDNDAFQLLITDLSFKEDHKNSVLKSGEELVEAVKKEYPDIKIIVYSVEDRPMKIKKMYEQYGIDGYVSKGRNSIAELVKAIEVIFQKGKYITESRLNSFKNDTILEIEPHDIELIKLLSFGMLQDEISKEFKDKSYSNSSLSSIEKRISKLKLSFEAKNITHLVSITKDMGLI